MTKNKFILVLAVLVVSAAILSACATLPNISGIVTKKIANGFSGSDLKPEDLQTAMSDLVLRPDDLPNDYLIPSGGEGRYANLAMINERGELLGKKYIVASKRVDGWQIKMTRANKEDIAPSYLESTIEIFEDSEGAKKAISKDWYKIYQTDEELPTFDDCNIGDECIMYHSSKHNAASNLTTLRYEVAFRYRNVMVWVMGRGLDVDVSPDYVLDAAKKVYDKLELFASGGK